MSVGGAGWTGWPARWRRRYHTRKGDGHAGDRRRQPQGRGRQEHAFDQPGGLSGAQRPWRDAGRYRPAAVVARMACAATGEPPRDRDLGGAARRRRARAQGHDACRARHAGRPARQAARRGDEACRHRARALAAEPLRHPRDARIRAQRCRRTSVPAACGSGWSACAFGITRSPPSSCAASSTNSPCRYSGTYAIRRTMCTSPRAASHSGM